MNPKRFVRRAGLCLALIASSCTHATQWGDTDDLEAPLESDAHAEHAAADSGGTMNLALATYIDRAAPLPQGDPGSGSEDIGYSGERPTTSDGVGAFRTVCDFSHMNYDDPIVFPGQPGKAHLHAYFGNALADAASTSDSLRSTGNSTCRGGTANRTAYWVPALIDRDGKPIRPQSLETYYKTGYNGIQPDEVQPFPRGLRMIAGDAKSSAPQTNAYWGCRQHYAGHPGSIPDCPAGDPVAMFVEFPQCWDGVNLDSSDHKSHMAYPRDGSCPSTHPVAVPAITMNVMYANPTGSSAGWRLASDMYDGTMPPGMSAHGDWMEAWDHAVVETFVERCLNPALDCHSHLLGDGRIIQ